MAFAISFVNQVRAANVVLTLNASTSRALSCYISLSDTPALNAALISMVYIQSPFRALIEIVGNNPLSNYITVDEV